MGNMTTRQHALKNWLDKNFVSGKYFTIEEICNANIGYTLNTNPKKHDKCVALSNDIRQINFNITDRYIPIIKNSRGSCKLAETKEEVMRYVERIKKSVVSKCEYYNTLVSKTKLDGTVPFINLANRTLEDSEIKPIDTLKR